MIPITSKEVENILYSIHFHYTVLVPDRPLIWNHREILCDRSMKVLVNIVGKGLGKNNWFCYKSYSFSRSLLNFFLSESFIMFVALQFQYTFKDGSAIYGSNGSPVSRVSQNSVDQRSLCPSREFISLKPTSYRIAWLKQVLLWTARILIEWRHTRETHLLETPQL